MEKFRGIYKTVIVGVISAAVGAGFVFLAFYFYFGGAEGIALIKKVNVVRDCIETYYVGEADMEELTDAAASAMVEATGDGWSYYMDSKSYESYVQQSNNTSTGIGVTVSVDEATGGFLVSAVTEGAPAERAGVQAGDVLIEVAGGDVTGMTLTEVGNCIRAQEGEYSLTLLDENGEHYTVTLRNEVISIEPVSYEMLEGGIGYIRISNFKKGAAEGTVEAIETLAQEGVGSIIFDVRSNPGGQLAELTELLDHILPDGEIFISVGKEGDEEIYTSDAECIDYPMVVLIDANTYSAAEFFAAALQEYDYATIVGQASTGKAHSQNTFQLYDGSAVHISTRSYLTPNRVNLAEEGGLVPDVLVELTGDTDTQLAEATKVLLDMG